MSKRPFVLAVLQPLHETAMVSSSIIFTLMPLLSNLHVILPLKPFNQIILSYSYHYQVISIKPLNG